MDGKITKEEILKAKGLEGLTEKEAQEAADALEKFCYLLIQILKKEHQESIVSKKKKLKQKSHE
jgi:hypothetical protein